MEQNRKVQVTHVQMVSLEGQTSKVKRGPDESFTFGETLRKLPAEAKGHEWRLLVCDFTQCGDPDCSWCKARASFCVALWVLCKSVFVVRMATQEEALKLSAFGTADPDVVHLERFAQSRNAMIS